MNILEEESWSPGTNTVFLLASGECMNNAYIDVSIRGWIIAVIGGFRDARMDLCCCIELESDCTDFRMSNMKQCAGK